MSNVELNKAEQTKALRRDIRARIMNLSAGYCLEADKAIIRLLIESEAFDKAEKIFCFVGRSNEIDTWPILTEILRRGKTLCVPLCTAEKGCMEARSLTDLSQLRPGRYGILEPDPKTSTLVEPEELDLVLAPCLSCTREGVRLGQGIGYYDRYLAKVQAPTVVLCREKLISESLPQEPWDLTFRYVLTENGLQSGDAGSHD